MQVTNSEPRLDYREISRKQKDYQDHWTKPRRKQITSGSPECDIKGEVSENVNDERKKSIVHIDGVISFNYLTTNYDNLLENIEQAYSQAFTNLWKHSFATWPRALNNITHGFAKVWLVDEPTSLTLESKFNKLMDEWRKDTSHLSSIEDKSVHYAYQRIIGMGNDALPFILKDLERQPGHWFWALSAITGENPIKEEDAGIMKNMAASWVEWGRKRGYL